MRTFHRAGTRILAAVFTVMVFSLPSMAANMSGEAHTGISPSFPPPPQANPSRTLAELRARLDQQDHIIALRALHLALTRVPDGGTFIWRKRSRSLKGVIKPTKAFRNAEGQVCRHLIYALALGRYSKQIEGIACRQEDGSWKL